MVPELVLLVGLPSSLPCMDGMLVCVVVWCVCAGWWLTHTLLGEGEQGNDENVQAGCVEDEHPGGGRGRVWAVQGYVHSYIW